MFRDIKGRYLRLGIIGDMKGYLWIFRDVWGYLGIFGDNTFASRDWVEQTIVIC
jgi:hypothetical protein